MIAGPAQAGLRDEAVGVLVAVFDAQPHTSLLALFKACVERVSNMMEEERRRHAKQLDEETMSHVVEKEQWPLPRMAIAASNEAKVKAAAEVAAKHKAQALVAAKSATAVEQVGVKRANDVKEASARVAKESGARDTAAVEPARHEAVEPVERETAAAKRALKKARERAVKEAAAAEEAHRLQRKQAKKERRQVDAEAKLCAEMAAKKAEAARPHATRIQCAVRRLLARCQRAELHRRKVQRKCCAAMRMWRHLMCRILRDVQGLRLMLRAARTAALQPLPSSAEVPKSRPSSLKAALVEGNWTQVRNSTHRVFKRAIMTSDGKVETQVTTLANTPSDYRSHTNQLAKLRGKLEEGVEQSYSIHDHSTSRCGGDGTREVPSKAEPLPHAPTLCADAGPSDDTPSQEELVLHATFLAFRGSMENYCPTFGQRKRVLCLLKAELAALKATEAKRAHSAGPTVEELSRWKELATCRLEDKRKWLGNEMMLMVDRGELTADEQRLVAAEFEDKLRLLHERVKQAGGGVKSSAEIEELRSKLESVREAKPFVWKLKFAKEIADHKKKLAELAELECPRSPLPLEEVQRLTAKPRLLKELAEMMEASRGWFADDAS